MRFHRITFAAGLACGYVAGTAAGRERYEQMIKFARATAQHPAVQQAAGTIQTQASNAAQKVGGQLHDSVPQMANSAMHSVGDKIPGVKHRSDNGHRDAAGNGGKATGNGGKGAGSGRPFAATTNSHLP